jgi:hypothetical protein
MDRGGPDQTAAMSRKRGKTQVHLGAPERTETQTRGTVDAAPAAGKGKASKGVAPVGMPTRPSEEPVAAADCHHLLGGDAQKATAKSKPDPSGSGKGQAENLRIRAADPRERARKWSPKLKPGEPHDRHQGATNLEGTRWSKPSQPGGTARTERVRKVASPDRRRLRAGRRGSSRIRTRRQLFGAAKPPGVDTSR